MADKIIIEIQTNPKLNWKRSAVTWSMIFAMFGASIYVDSAAMQWFSFILIWMSLTYISSKLSKKDKGLTIEQARDRLDEIAGEEADHG